MDKRRADMETQFADATITLLLDQYAETDGLRLLQEYQSAPQKMPDTLDSLCQNTIQKAYKSTLIRSTLKRAASAAACILIALTMTSQLIMHVEAFRIPVLNFLLKQEKKFTEISFTGSASHDTTLDQLRMLIWMAVPDSYQFDFEKVFTDILLGTETVTSFSTRFKNNQGSSIFIFVQKAEGTINIDSEDATVTTMELYGQQAILVEKEGEMQVLWVNDEQSLVYSVTGYGMESSVFWAYVQTLSENVSKADADISFG